MKEAGLDEAEPPQLYLPYRQWPVQSMSVVLKTAVPPATVTDAARRAVYATDPNMPAANVRTLEQIVARSISQPRFYTTLLAVFAGLALVLAAIGIFGVLSYAVAQRTREIGIRMALGAQERTVLGLVVRQALLLAAAGVGIGMILALGLSRSLVSKMLFSTSPTTPRRLSAWPRSSGPWRSSRATFLRGARRAWIRSSPFARSNGPPRV